ncbi:MAG: adenylate kinase [Candidatus Odinarchaeia archaeon]
MTLVIIGGVPGSGKTTICKRVEKESDIKVFNLGDVIYNISKKMFPDKIKVREDTRKIPLHQYFKIQVEAAKLIKEAKEDKVVDTHLALKTPRGYYPGLPQEVLKILSPEAIILIETDPEEIIRRREKDREAGVRASRDKENIAEIEEHQQINKLYGVAYSASCGCYLKIINLRWAQEYPFQHTEIASKVIIDLIKKQW